MSNIASAFRAAACLALVTLAGAAAQAADDTPACGAVTGVQRRIVDRADQGIEVLRGYVARTNFVYGIDMVEVQASLDNWRAAVECQQAVARAAAAARVAVADKAPDAGR